MQHPIAQSWASLWPLLAVLAGIGIAAGGLYDGLVLQQYASGLFFFLLGREILAFGAWAVERHSKRLAGQAFAAAIKRAAKRPGATDDR